MRLEVSKRTDLALRALAHLNSNGPSSGASIAESIETTTNYLPQVLKPLIVSGWIQSTPGPNGGYSLGASLEDISVLELVEAIEGELGDRRCVLRGVPCPAQEKCALHDSWVRARDALLAELDATSLATAVASAPTKGE